MLSTVPDHCDVAIVGGGLAGASLAAALANTPLEVVVIEPYPADHAAQPSYNERTVALTWSARQIYSGIGIWTAIVQSGIEPIIDIHVSARGQYGMTHLHSSDVGTEALGYVAPTRALGKVLYDTIKSAPNITTLEGFTADDIRHGDTHSVVGVTRDDAASSINSNLVVLADGGRSALGEQFAAVKEAYPQQALLTFVTVDQPHCGRAYERFTSEGPLALLPHSGNRYAVVWTCDQDNLKQRMAMNDADFLDALQDTFGDRAGTFSCAAPRTSYPLGRLKLEDTVRERCVVIGNAAHIVHPVAGQGFNLGLRDVAALADAIAENTRIGADIGDSESLGRYAQSRERDAARVRQFTHGLIGLFSQTGTPAKLARSALLHGVETCPPAKRFLLRRTMGLSARHSRLAMGLPLDFAIRENLSEADSGA